MDHDIVVKDVKKAFGDKVILEGISFSVNKGEFVSVIGPNGCGKTVLLHMIQGFQDSSEGSIETKGKTGFVFQDHNLFPWKTVKENIEIGPINTGNKDAAEKISKRLLKEFNLAGFVDYYPNQLSEGMKQMVGIIRSLAIEPDILLMDEPFASLDYLTRMKMHGFIRNILDKRKERPTVLLVTHDIEEALQLSNRIIVLSRRPAKIIKDIPVPIDFSQKKGSKIKDKMKYLDMKERIIRLLKKHG
jgi:NitT/TauT family transport system ATP-binding protein